MTSDERRALELLAACREGITEALMQAHGFAIPLMVKLARTGLADVFPERIRGIEIARLKISDHGRAALKGAPARTHKISGMSRNKRPAAAVGTAASLTPAKGVSPNGQG